MGRLSLTWVLVFVFGSSVALGAKKLATVNGQSITDQDLNQALKHLNEQQRKTALKDRNNRSTLLHQLIDQELLFQEGKRLKVDQSAEFKAAMEAYRRQALVSFLVQKQTQGKFTPKLLKQFYKQNINQFTTDTVHALHILVSDEAKARKILTQAKKTKSAEEFMKLAEKVSEDPSAKQNRGDLGYFTQGRLDETFTRAAFSTKDGNVSGPVKTQFGYHIIRVVDHKTGKPLDYEEVELQVRAAYQKRLVKRMVLKLKRKAKIKIN